MGTLPFLKKCYNFGIDKRTSGTFDVSSIFENPVSAPTKKKKNLDIFWRKKK